MSGTLADRLAARRRRGFVGRAAELAHLASLLDAAELPVAVLSVHGPAGVGKSTLLRRYAELAAERGIPCVLLDARELPPTPRELAAAVAAAGDALGPPGTPRSLLLVDTVELLAGLDQVLRDQVLPQLPDHCLVVLAGQHPLPSSWRTDLGWAALLQELELGNFTADEGATYLRAKDVPEERLGDALAFTRGHPLALALVTDVIQRRGTFEATRSPDVIQVLVERLVQVVPSAVHRRALEAGAQVRVLTEPLLAAMLDLREAGEIFGWLRGLTVVQARPAGLYVHDLARDVLAADLRWRDPALYAALHDRARAHYVAGLGAPDPALQAAALMDLMFLHPQLRRYLRPPDPGGLVLGPARPGDAPGMRDLVARHEGEESARLADRWLAGQPEAWHVVRDPDGRLEGLLCALTVDASRPALASTAAGAGDDPVDPAVAAAVRQLAALPALREGERATLFRWWLAADTYQALSPVQSLIAAQLGRYWLNAAGLAVSMLVFAEPEAWTEFAAYADQHRWPAADFTVGGRSYGVYGHDWRQVTPAEWLAALALRETGQDPPAASAPVLTLDHDQFAAGVRRALRDLHRPDRLRDNPLLGSRLVVSRAGAEPSLRDRVVALQEQVRGAVAAMQEAPAAQDRRAYRLLHRAYLAPAATLERAAEALNLPSSTFRRHLADAVARVVEQLWEAELRL